MVVVADAGTKFPLLRRGQLGLDVERDVVAVERRVGRRSRAGGIEELEVLVPAHQARQGTRLERDLLREAQQVVQLDADEIEAPVFADVVECGIRRKAEGRVVRGPGDIIQRAVAVEGSREDLGAHRANARQSR